MATVDDLIFALTMFASLGCGLIAGVFFAFSSFVMKALARLAPREGILAMQSINRVVINPLFLGVFLGTAAACALLIISSLLRWQAGSIYSVIGAALYLVGSLMVTILFNVPKNNALARIAPDDTGSVRLWADYVASWTAWNHVRAAASLAAAAAFIIGMARCHHPLAGIESFERGHTLAVLIAEFHFPSLELFARNQHFEFSPVFQVSSTGERCLVASATIEFFNSMLNRR